MMKVYVYTLGCRLNQCESEALADAFAQDGYDVLKQGESADLYIVNTCTVTSKSEQKARRMIRKYALEAQNPVVLVTGCYAQMERKNLEKLHPSVVVVSLDEKASLLSLPRYVDDQIQAGMTLLEAVRTFSRSTDSFDISPFAYQSSSFHYHSRAYVKIQDGCDNACNYCRVCVARGKAVFLPPAEVVRRALELEAQGYHELVLTGVNLTMYDHFGRGLGGVVENLLAALGSDIRIRLSSMEPDHVDELLLEQFQDYRMQPFAHIPIQSASQEVLSRANRYDSVEHIALIIKRLREVKGDPFIAADIITGLPGEGDDEFKMTYDFVREQQLSQLHVFPFSPRPGTVFSDAKDRVTERVRDERATIMRELSQRLYDRYIHRQHERTSEVILEEKKQGMWTGTTGNSLKVPVYGVPMGMRKGSLLSVKLVLKDGVLHAECL